MRSIQAADVTVPADGPRAALEQGRTSSASRARTGSTSRGSRSASSASPTPRTSAPWSCCSARSCCCASARPSTSSRRATAGSCAGGSRTACSSPRAAAAAGATSRSTSAACRRRRTGWSTVHVEVEVASFYPAIATWLTGFVYSHTQSKIHVLVTHGFLRSLARLELEESAVGRFAEQQRGVRQEKDGADHRRRDAVGLDRRARDAAGVAGRRARGSGCCAATNRRRSPSAPAACRGRART